MVMKIGLIFPDWGVRLETLEPFSGFVEYNNMVDEVLNNRSNPLYRQAVNTALPIIASCAPPDAEVKIIDDRYEKINYTEDFDLIGITMMTCQAVRGYEIADEFRKRGVKVAIGGIHATVLPEETKTHADIVFIGEAEVTFPQMIRDLEKNEPRPFYKAEKRIHLSQIPPPRYDLLSNSGYYTMIWTQTSRGCPHDCEYCTITKVNGRKIRSKSIEQIVSEIECIKEHFGDYLIGFGDDNMLARSNRKAAKEILKALIPLKIRWYSFTDVTLAKDEELLDLAARSGCRVLIIGFESLSAESLKNIDRSNWKYKQFKNYTDAVEKIQAKGIGVLGSFMMGLDGDDADTFKHTLDFIVNTNMYSNGMNVVTPFPGTRLRDRYIQENRVLPTGWDNYTKTGINIIPKKMSLEQFTKCMIQLLKDLYYDNRVLYQKLNHLKKLAYENKWC
jgi:radical SAM superfamily enzyme YgiQ (UPF0313 family)